MAKDLAADYRGAGFNQRLGFGERPALAVIDFVAAYFVESSPLYAGCEAALDAGIRVLEAARAAAIPVIHTRVEYSKGGANGGVFYRKVGALENLQQGSPLGAFAGGIVPREDEVVVTKQYASAFFGTSLSSTLAAMGIDTLIMVGVSTSGCIRASALDACQHGFIPIVVREAVGDRDPRPHEANLFDIDAKYGDVVSEAEVMDYLHRIGNRRLGARAAG